MKKTFPIFVLLFGFLLQIQAQSVASRGIVSGKSFSNEDLSSEFFDRKEKRYDKARNQRLREQNQRLELKISSMERRLDDCTSDRTRRRYPKRRNDNRYSLQQNYWGERKIEREYEQLKEENIYLRDYHDWLSDELEDCQRSYDRDRNRGRSRDDYRRPRQPQRDYKDYGCNCQKERDHHQHRGKHEHKGHGKHQHKHKSKHHGHSHGHKGGNCSRDD